MPAALCPVCDRPIGQPVWRIPLWAPLATRARSLIDSTTGLPSWPTPIGHTMDTCSAWCGEIAYVAYTRMMATDPDFWTKKQLGCVQKLAVAYLPPGETRVGELILPCEQVGPHTEHVAHFSDKTFTWLA